MSVDTQSPLSVEARVIPAPALTYGAASKEPRVVSDMFLTKIL